MSKMQINDKIESLLTSYGLRKTSLRREILRVFLTTQEVVSQADLLQTLLKTLPSVDRVSLYRNLKELKSQGIVHEVEVNSYIACAHDCEKHPHLLLFCQNCHRHEEIKDHGKISNLLSGLGKFKFFGPEHSLSIRGLCKTCSQ